MTKAPNKSAEARRRPPSPPKRSLIPIRGLGPRKQYSADNNGVLCSFIPKIYIYPHVQVLHSHQKRQMRVLLTT